MWIRFNRDFTVGGVDYEGGKAYDLDNHKGNYCVQNGLGTLLPSNRTYTEGESIAGSVNNPEAPTPEDDAAAAYVAP